MGTGVQPNLWPRLTELNIPVQLITGEYDQKFILIAQKMGEKLPNSQHKIISGSGHTVHLERPTEWITAVQRFIAPAS